MKITGQNLHIGYVKGSAGGGRGETEGSQSGREGKLVNVPLECDGAGGLKAYAGEM